MEKEADMSRKKNLKTAATTFSVALGIGFVMQYGDAVASRFQPQEQSIAPVVLTPEMVIPADEVAMSIIAVPAIAIPRPDEEVVKLAALNTTLNDVSVPEMEAPTVLAEPDCAVNMTADTLPMAMVALSVTAPCNPNAAVTIHHQGLMFSLLTDEKGALEVLVPAMSQDAFFISSLADGGGAVASTQVPEMANVDRAALQWQGVNAVQLHAREFGAGYGSAGHVWKAAARGVDFKNTEEAGFLVSLGDSRVDNPLFVEIYTFPSGMGQRDGSVALTVEAEVTAQNCGRDIAAQSIQINEGINPTAIDLTMTMPECGAIGEFLVLNNMFKDLTLAAK